MHTYIFVLLNVTQAQLSSLPPLRVPKRLVVKRRSDEQQQEEEEKEGVQSENQTDQEKSVLKRTAALIEVLPLSLSLSPPSLLCLSPSPLFLSLLPFSLYPY